MIVSTPPTQPFMFTGVSELAASPVRNFVNPVQVYRYNPYLSHNLISDRSKDDCLAHSI